MQRCTVKLEVEKQFQFLDTYYFYCIENKILNLNTNVKSRLRAVVALGCLLYYTAV